MDVPILPYDATTTYTTSSGMRTFGRVSVCFVTVALMWAADGNVAVALARPVLGGLIGARAVAFADRYTLRTDCCSWLLLVDNPTERPGRACTNRRCTCRERSFTRRCKKRRICPASKFTGLQIFDGLALAIIGLRIIFGQRIDGRDRPAAASAQIKACITSMLTFDWPMGVRHRPWRQDQLFHAANADDVFHAPMTLFFAYAFKSRRDIRILAYTFLTVAFLRAYVVPLLLADLHAWTSKAGGQEGDGSLCDHPLPTPSWRRWRSSLRGDRVSATAHRSFLLAAFLSCRS